MDMNKEKRKIYNDKYRETHYEEIKARNKIYREKNREKIRQSQKEYFHRNHEKILERQKVWTRRFYNEHKDIHQKRNRERWIKYRNEIYEKLGGKKCVKCGFADERALAIDHINNDGYRDRKLSKSISQIRRRVLENLEKYQILCFNCNQIKRIEYEKENRLKKEGLGHFLQMGA